ncbi:MAG: phosphatase PAP2 family protein [Terriglobales bacterium]
MLGSAKHNDHLAETGRLGEEAIVNSLLVVEALKLATNRERPNEGNGRGGFWPHGTRSYETDGSFSSGHAIATFAFARVIASEYPSKPVQIGAYAFALAVSASRVTAREHFPSDVLVGGTLGYLIGGYVIHHHATDGEASAFPFTPMLEQSTHTYGLHMEFTPGGFNLNKAGRFVGWLRSTR